MILRLFVQDKVEKPYDGDRKGAKEALKHHHVKTLAQWKTQDQDIFAQDRKTKKAGSEEILIYTGATCKTQEEPSLLRKYA